MTSAVNGPKLAASPAKRNCFLHLNSAPLKLPPQGAKGAENVETTKHANDTNAEAVATGCSLDSTFRVDATQ
jgi:hypothetical protein